MSTMSKWTFPPPTHPSPPLPSLSAPANRLPDRNWIILRLFFVPLSFVFAGARNQMKWRSSRIEVRVENTDWSGGAMLIYVGMATRRPQWRLWRHSRGINKRAAAICSDGDVTNRWKPIHHQRWCNQSDDVDGLCLIGRIQADFLFDFYQYFFRSIPPAVRMRGEVPDQEVDVRKQMKMDQMLSTD